MDVRGIAQMLLECNLNYTSIIWAIVLALGIILLVLSSSKRYIDWIKKYSPSSDREIKKREKRLAIGFIIIATLYLLQALFSCLKIRG